jgi:hypothetical protein
MPKSGVFFVTDELQQALDNLPADEPRSRLEPFRVFILRWRREGRSYERIRQILRDQCKLQVSGEAVRKFVQLRSRPRKVQPEYEPVVLTETLAADQARVPRLRRSPEEIAAMREAAKSSNHNPAFQPEEETRPVFIYDPSKPLTNKSIRKD